MHRASQSDPLFGIETRSQGLLITVFLNGSTRPRLCDWRLLMHRLQRNVRDARAPVSCRLPTHSKGGCFPVSVPKTDFHIDAPITLRGSQSLGQWRRAFGEADQNRIVVLPSARDRAWRQGAISKHNHSRIRNSFARGSELVFARLHQRFRQTESLRDKHESRT